MKSENKNKLSPIPREEIYLDAILNGKKDFPDPITRKEHYLAAIAEKGIGEGGSADLSDYYTKQQTDQRITAKVAEIVADAPEDFDTLKELSDWIANHEDSAAAMNSAIATNTSAIAQKADKSTTYTKTETDDLLDDKVSKESGKRLSTNDFTDADKSKLDGLKNYDDTDIKGEIAKTAEQSALNRSTLGYQRKNLLKNTAVTQTKNGVTFTINDDGIVTVNGTATADTICYLTANGSGGIKDNFNRSIILSGCPKGGSYAKFSLGVELQKNGSYKGSLDDYGSGRIYNEGNIEHDGYYAFIRIRKDITMNDAVFKPMIRYTEITDDTYEPYKPSVEERLAALEEKFAALEGGAT